VQQRPAQQVQRLPGQQVQRLPEPAQLPEPARQLQEPEQPQQALRRGQPLLLFCPFLPQAVMETASRAARRTEYFI